MSYDFVQDVFQYNISRIRQRTALKHEAAVWYSTKTYTYHLSKLFKVTALACEIILCILLSIVGFGGRMFNCRRVI